jgi:hypothetical protein
MPDYAAYITSAALLLGVGLQCDQSQAGHASLLSLAGIVAVMPRKRSHFGCATVIDHTLAVHTSNDTLNSGRQV